MANKGFDAYGVDAAAEAVAWAQERMRNSETNVDLRVGNIVDLASYSDDFFDFVFDGECLHCVIGQDRETCLANVFRVLKRGGLFYVQGTCVNKTLKESVNISQGVYFDQQNQCLVRNGIPYYYLSREEELLGEIQKAGFRIAYREKVPKTSEHESFQSGGLLVNAVKP
jgi:ubiquinone/menaquinone biosynthesis C-methylase UbiE